MAEYISEQVDGVLKVDYEVQKHLHSEKSPFQQIDVVESRGLGKMLFNDHIGMLSEKDEFVYHDMIAHVPLFTHPNPKQVLVIGGGDGGTVREVLRHKNVQRVTLVEIDEVVIKACKEHIPQVSCELENPRCRVLIEDGAKFVRETEEQFDVVIVDSTDPLGPSMPLFNVDFYENVMRILSDDGLCVSQAESPFYMLKEQVDLLKIKKQVFPRLFLYKYSNLVYPGGIWCLSMGSKGLSPIEDFQKEKAQKRDFETQYYTPQMHLASFVLPAFMEKALNGLVENISKES